MAKIKGRPEVYSDEELREILFKYATNNVGKITYLQLEKTTGIKRHVWSRRMKDEIELLNHKELGVKGEKFEKILLPNIVDVVESNWGNKEGLINALLPYNEYIQSLWDRAVLQEKAKEREKKLVEEIEKLKNENKYLVENRDFYKSEYEKICVESTYTHKRKKKTLIML